MFIVPTQLVATVEQLVFYVLLGFGRIPFLKNKEFR
jgi:hypothetical protein